MHSNLFLSSFPILCFFYLPPTLFVKFSLYSITDKLDIATIQGLRTKELLFNSLVLLEFHSFVCCENPFLLFLVFKFKTMSETFNWILLCFQFHSNWTTFPNTSACFCHTIVVIFKWNELFFFVSHFLSLFHLLTPFALVFSPLVSANSNKL